LDESQGLFAQEHRIESLTILLGRMRTSNVKTLDLVERVAAGWARISAYFDRRVEIRGMDSREVKIPVLSRKTRQGRGTL